MVFRLFLAVALVHVAVTWAAAVRRGRAARLRDAAAPAGGPFQPSLSVVVPAWNELGRIEHCIRSLQVVTYPAWEAIILAGGRDGTYEAALQAAAGDARFRVLERGPEPKNVALTRGIAASRNDIVVLLDADSIVTPEWLGALVASMASGASAAYGFYLPMKWTWISTEEYMVQIQYHNAQAAVFPGCASVAIRREALASTGSLTPEAYSWEDWDVYARLIDAGFRIVPAPKAHLYTDRPATLREFWTNNLRAFRTHWAGLWFHRRIVLRHPLWAVRELLFLVYGPALCLAAAAGVALLLVQPAWLPAVAQWVGLAAPWILGRRAALAGEVAAYTGERKWLQWWWAPALLLLVQIPATLFAVLTVRQQPAFDYKGPRVRQAPNS